jgi:hypothetical protein
MNWVPSLRNSAGILRGVSHLSSVAHARIAYSANSLTFSMVAGVRVE